ncbi:MAG: hypothetical protein E7097_04065 [Bacteroides sp.]|nr:hypothetical protein [Bacteroides sp.]
MLLNNINNINIMSRQLLTELENFLDDRIEDLFNNDEFTTLVNNSEKLTEIKRLGKKLRVRINENSSNACIVVIVGTVKSGKSTLVNLLANANVSPIGVLETTKYPLIIANGAMDENGIVVEGETCLYSLGDENRNAERISSVINNIRLNGLTENDFEQIQEFGTVSDPNVILKKIYARGGDLLRENVYIIDMPGFDGFQANDDNPYYQTIIREADFLIYVQSSTSVINEKAHDFLNKLHDINPNVPICLLHNFYDAAYWLSNEEKNIKRQTQLQEGISILQSQGFLINNTNQAERRFAFTINLGKISDFRGNRVGRMWQTDDLLNDFEDECDLFNEKQNQIYDCLFGNPCILLKNRISRLLVQIKETDEYLKNKIEEKYKQIKESKERIIFKEDDEIIRNTILLKLQEESKFETVINVIKAELQKKNGYIGGDTSASYIKCLRGPFKVSTARKYLKQFLVFFGEVITNVLESEINIVSRIIQDENRILMTELAGIQLKVEEYNPRLTLYSAEAPSCIKDIISKYDVEIERVLAYQSVYITKKELKDYAYCMYQYFLELIDKDEFKEAYLKDLISYYKQLAGQIKENYYKQIERLKEYDEKEFEAANILRNWINIINSYENI